MKKIIGFLILLIVLIGACGCTQQAKPTTATPTATTEAPTTEKVTSVETTVVPTVETTTEATTPAATSTPEANVTAPITETTGVVEATTAPITASMTPSTKVTVIHIVNNTFTPSVLMIYPGTGITWLNDDSTVHTIKAIGDHAGKFNSGEIPKGVQWSYTFGAAEGTFEYADGLNQNITGTIIVRKGASLVGNVITQAYVTSNATW